MSGSPGRERARFCRRLTFAGAMAGTRELRHRAGRIFAGVLAEALDGREIMDAGVLTPKEHPKGLSRRHAPQRAYAAGRGPLTRNPMWKITITARGVDWSETSVGKFSEQYACRPSSNFFSVTVVKVMSLFRCFLCEPRDSSLIYISSSRSFDLLE